jgi:preprotein translocase subunit Sec63
VRTYFADRAEARRQALQLVDERRRTVLSNLSEFHQKTTGSECQKAYRTLIAQYHPDKVAHLAPEFRKMAAEKSLQLNLAI